MRFVAKCPWCYEPVLVDDRRLDGGPAALAHVPKCAHWPLKRPQPNGSSSLPVGGEGR